MQRMDLRAHGLRKTPSDSAVPFFLRIEPLELRLVVQDCEIGVAAGPVGVFEAGAPGFGDMHPRFGWPSGANDTPEVVEFIRALLLIGYLKAGSTPRPWVGFEVKPLTPEETPELVIASAKRVWQEAWSQA